MEQLRASVPEADFGPLSSLLVGADPVEVRGRIAATVWRIASGLAARGSPLPVSACAGMVTRAASLIDSFHPWLSPADADLVAARAHAAEIGSEASGASGAAEAQPAAKRPRPAAASVLPTPAQTRSLVARLSGNPGLAGEVLRAGEAYQGVKVATSARVGTHVFKSDAFDSFGFRLALWPRPFRGDSLADELRTFAWATRPWHGALTARQRERVTEFVTTGRIARGDLAQASQDATARLAFRDVHGIGPSRAVELWTAGFRSASSLLALPPASLRSLGVAADSARALRFAKSAFSRHPRALIERVAATVREQAALLFPGIEVVIGGSFRRGQSTAGDVDILLFHRDGPCALVPALVARLSRPECGLLTEHLKLPGPVLCMDAHGEEREFPGLRYAGPDSLRSEWEAIPDAESAETSAGEGRAGPSLVRLPSDEQQRDAEAELANVPSRPPDLLAMATGGTAASPLLSEGELCPAVPPDSPRVASPRETARVLDPLKRQAAIAALLLAPSSGNVSAAAAAAPRTSSSSSPSTRISKQASLSRSSSTFPARHPHRQGSSCANVASTDALNGPDRSTPGFHEPQLYCGIARLPAAAGAPPSEGPSYLRIDIKSWHWSQRGTALVAFTGNNRFNRALRRYADVLGLHLSDRAMCNRVLQGERPAGDRWNDEPRVVTEEAHVFKELGLEFRQPHERLVFFVDQMHSALEEAAGLAKDSRQGGSASSNSAT
ncbi:hypothetical protein FNF27_02992 [Cafeteria roenbergensis]|uniref:DNA-directed DNA polymerase X domain-containing protein n=1 Tax=Cafeteria roenbergensis TaxID=33653 RepID=A0A5A8EDK4_CAFRO|nr:hypothetical protein FNF27_02992 [Cafeteria roenbergensis]